MTVEAYRPVARSIEQLANDYVKEQFPLGADFEPNLQIVVNAINAAEVSNPSLRLGGPVVRSIVRGIITGQNVNDGAVRLQVLNTNGTARYRLCENPQYRQALNGALDINGKIRDAGNEKFVVRTAIERSIPLDDETGLSDIVAELFDQLTSTPEHESAVGAANLRRQRTDEMTSGGSKPFSLRTASGNSRTYDSQGREIQFSGSGGRRFIAGDQGFAGMADDQIKAMHDQWSQEQKYKSMSTEDLRKQVRQQGKERFEQKFHTDPTTGEPVAATTATTEPLYDPRDGSVIDTKAKLIRYINSSYPASKILLAPHGKIIEARAREYERLINQRD